MSKPSKSNPQRVERAKNLRETQTEAEGLLWSFLRSRQLCRLKFRRQHWIGPFFVDFACASHNLVVELDGLYHDSVQEEDLRRQRYLERLGWTVIRFTNDDVMNDVEAVIRAIARQLDQPFEFHRRTSSRSGMMNEGTQR